MKKYRKKSKRGMIVDKKWIRRQGKRMFRTYKEVFVCLALMVLLSIILSIAIQVFAQNCDVLGQWYFSMSLQAVLLGTVVLFLVNIDKEKSIAMLGLGRIGKAEVKTAIWSGCFLFLVMFVLGKIFAILFPQMGVQDALQGVLEIGGIGQFLLMLFIGAVLIPISEELLFRGYVYNGLASRMRTKKAMVATSVIFAILHMDLYRFLLFLLGGLWLNAVYVKHHSLWMSAIAHGIWNGLMLCLLLG